MSTRNTPRLLDERVASIEKFIRDLKAERAVRPTDTRFLYTAAGDILVAVAPNDPQPTPVGGVGTVLTVGPAGVVEWQDPDRIRLSLLGLKGYLPVGIGPEMAGGLPPGANGTVLTADNTSVFGVTWV